MFGEDRFIRRTIPDRRIASIRYVGDPGEASARFAKLRGLVEPYIAGGAIRLVHWSAGQNSDVEVAYPVSEEVSEDPVKTRVLSGDELLCVRHEGPLAPPEAEGSLSKAAGRLFAHAREIGYLIAEGPFRLAYLREGDELKSSQEVQFLEFQAPLFLTEWLCYLSAGLEKHVGEEVRQQVMAGVERITEGTPVTGRVGWVKGVIGKLDRAVSDPQLSAKILAGCAHRFPQVLIERFGKILEKAENLDELLEVMRKEKPEEFHPDYPKHVGNKIHEIKVPSDPSGYRSAESDLEQRISYCFCPTLRAAMRAGEPISPTYCYCGAGWFVQKWEGILQNPVEVELIRSVLKGDDACEFAVHLPADAVWK